MSPATRHLPYDLRGHVALVTGANHGIGAATAKALAACGASVLLNYYRTSDPEDFPEPYRTNRAKTADDVIDAIHSEGGHAVSMEADIRDPTVVPKLFDFAEAELAHVDILVNNATGWVADTFTLVLLPRFRFGPLFRGFRGSDGHGLNVPTGFFLYRSLRKCFVYEKAG